MPPRAPFQVHNQSTAAVLGGQIKSLAQEEKNGNILQIYKLIRVNFKKFHLAIINLEEFVTVYI